jgi:hypothetical protein
MAATHSDDDMNPAAGGQGEAMKKDNKVPDSEVWIELAAERIDILRYALETEVKVFALLLITNCQEQCRAEELLVRLNTLSVTSSDPAEMAKDTCAFHDCYEELRDTVREAVAELRARWGDRSASRTHYDPSPN